MALELALGLLQFEDVKSKVSKNDKQTNFLEQKLVAGTNMTINKLNSGGVETLEFVSSGGGGGDGNGMFDVANEGGSWAITSATTRAGGTTTINLASTRNLLFNSISGGDLRFVANDNGSGLMVYRGTLQQISFLTDPTNGGIINLKNPANSVKVAFNGGVNSNIGNLDTDSHSLGLGVAGANIDNKLHIDTDQTFEGVRISYLGSSHIQFMTEGTSFFFNTVNNNLAIGGKNVGANANNVLGFINGDDPDVLANCTQLFAKDATVGDAESTLAIVAEQAVEAIGTFTPSHKLSIWINAVEYHISLDAV